LTEREGHDRHTGSAGIAMFDDDITPLSATVVYLRR